MTQLFMSHFIYLPIVPHNQTHKQQNPTAPPWPTTPCCYLVFPRPPLFIDFSIAEVFFVQTLVAFSSQPASSANPLTQIFADQFSRLLQDDDGL